MKYFDVHTHPFLEYYEDPEQVISSWFKENMKLMFFVGVDEPSSKEVVKMIEKFDNLWGIIGIHPNESHGAIDGEIIEKLLTKKIIAIGEIGLDYHYDNTPSKEIQLESLKSQVEVARKHNLVVMLHIRDAMEDAIQFVSQEQYKDLTFVFHSYSGNAEETERLLRLNNVYFSISGVVTFKNAKSLQEAVKMIPIDRIFTETDTPYLAPTPMRGKDNISPYVMYTTKFIAAMKNVSETTLLKQIEENIEKVFKVHAS
ncbi:TatD family hydrolase [Mycoplasma sp. 1573]